MRTFEYQLLNSGDMSQATLTAGPIKVDQMVTGMIQAVWTGASAAGTLKVQVSNDNATYSDYIATTTSVSGPGNAIFKFDTIQFPWVQLLFTKTSGSGSLNVTFYGKGL